MALIIFLIVLSVLIFVHEVGHFAVAKFFGIRVDEFGLGLPPKVKSLFNWKGTEFTLNWLPFGGFVKIFGEDGEISQNNAEKTQNNAELTLRRSAYSPHGSASFQEKNRGIQASVLVAGVVMNFVFAWFLISLGFMVGMPSPATESFPVDNVETVITSVVTGSPAEVAGIEAGDVIVSALREDAVQVLSAREVSSFIGNSTEPISFEILRRGETVNVTVTPQEDASLERPIIGVSMEDIGVARLPFFQSISQGLKTSIEITVYTAGALWDLVSQAFRGNASLSGLTGPVGLVGVVGGASELGFAYLLSLTAVISLNLAIINLLPFPALDGGRLLVVFFEAVSRRSVPARITGALNTAGFLLLIFLMVVVTIHDISNIL